MLEDPGELLVQHRVLGVVLDRLVADQLDPFVHPAPAVLETRTGDRNVVGHIPCQISGRAGERGLQVGNPARQLDHFEIAALLLQRSGPQPEQVRHESPETAQRNRGERHQRRSILDLAGEAQIMLRDGAVEPPLHPVHAEKQYERHADQREIHDKGSEFTHLRITNPSSRRR